MQYGITPEKAAELSRLLCGQAELVDVVYGTDSVLEYLSASGTSMYKYPFGLSIFLALFITLSISVKCSSECIIVIKSYFLQSSLGGSSHPLRRIVFTPFVFASSAHFSEISNCSGFLYPFDKRNLVKSPLPPAWKPFNFMRRKSPI